MRRSWTWSVTSEKRSWKMRARSRCSSRRSVGMIGWWDSTVWRWYHRFLARTCHNDVSKFPPSSHKHLCKAVVLYACGFYGFSPQSNRTSTRWIPLAWQGFAKRLQNLRDTFEQNHQQLQVAIFRTVLPAAGFTLAHETLLNSQNMSLRTWNWLESFDWRLVTCIIMYLTSFQLLRLFFLRPKRRGLELVGYLWRFLQSQCPYCWTILGDGDIVDPPNHEAQLENWMHIILGYGHHYVPSV